MLAHTKNKKKFGGGGGGGAYLRVRSNHIYRTFYEILILVNLYINIAYNLNRNIFRTIYAIDFVFSAHHTKPFLYMTKLYFDVLHKQGPTLLGLIPMGFKTSASHIGGGAFKSLQIRCVHRGVLSLMIYFIHYGDTAVHSHCMDSHQ